MRGDISPLMLSRAGVRPLSSVAPGLVTGGSSPSLSYVDALDYGDGLDAVTTRNISIPAGATTGDLMVLLSSRTDSAWDNPAGWTAHYSDVVDGSRYTNIWYKFKTVSDTGVTLSSASNKKGVETIFVVRNAIGTGPNTPTRVEDAGSPSSLDSSPPTVSTAGSLVFYLVDGDAAVTPLTVEAGLTEVSQAESTASSASAHGVFYEATDTTPEVRTFTFDASAGRGAVTSFAILPA